MKAEKVFACGGLHPGDRFVLGRPRRGAEVFKVIYVLDRTPEDWEIRVQSEQTKERHSFMMGPKDAVRRVIMD